MTRKRIVKDDCFGSYQSQPDCYDCKKADPCSAKWSQRIWARTGGAWPEDSGNWNGSEDNAIKKIEES